MTADAKIAVLFPGQGASVAGCRSLIEQHCASLYAAACRELDADPLQDTDTSTRLSQPAIFLAGLASWRACKEAGLQAYALAGHSLGEITALTAAGALLDHDALALVILRATLMDRAAKAQPGGMVAILKGSTAQAEQLARRHGLHIANYNAPGQTVLSGAHAALDAATGEAREEGLKALKLSVTGPFHSPAVASAVQPLRRALAQVEHRAPYASVFSSMSAAPFSDPATQLAEAVTRPVRWSETIAALERHGAEAYLDIGPDRVLERLTARNLSNAAILDRDELHALA